jgi:hypothetical protein
MLKVRALMMFKLYGSLNPPAWAALAECFPFALRIPIYSDYIGSDC